MVPEMQQEISIGNREDRFHLLLDAVRDYAIFLLDAEGRIATWNAGAERILAYDSREAIGTHYSFFYTEDDVRSGKPQRQLEEARNTGRFEDESWHVRKDGSKFWAGVVITALRDQKGRVYGFAKVTRDLTERRAAEQALRQSMEQLQTEIRQRIEAEHSVRDLSARLLRLQDEERRQLGRELHDVVGQLLAGVKMTLNVIGGEKDESKFQRQLAECGGLLDEAIAEVRTMSYLLYPPMLEDMGLKNTVEWYVEGFQQRSGIGVTFEAAADFPRLPRDLELVLFRVLQESLTNVYRHSGSATARVMLQADSGMAVLEVQDQGKGIASPKAANEARIGSFGVGLRGMTERVHQLGGTLELFSIGTGTTVRACVPVQGPED